MSLVTVAQNVEHPPPKLDAGGFNSQLKQYIFTRFPPLWHIRSERIFLPWFQQRGQLCWPSLNDITHTCIQVYYITHTCMQSIISHILVYRVLYHTYLYTEYYITHTFIQSIILRILVYRVFYYAYFYTEYNITHTFIQSIILHILLYRVLYHTYLYTVPTCPVPSSSSTISSE